MFDCICFISILAVDHASDVTMFILYQGLKFHQSTQQNFSYNLMKKDFREFTSQKKSGIFWLY